MPKKASKPATCCQAGIVTDGKCSNGCDTKVIKKSKNRDRASSTARGYGSDWQKFRRLYFYQYSPLCHDCTLDGKTTPATDLHHKQKIKHRPELRLSEKNVLPLCSDCHDRRSAQGE